MHGGISESLDSYPGITSRADTMASSTPCRKSWRAVRFTSCHKHRNLSLLSIFKIYLHLPRQFPASSKLHSPSSLSPVLNFCHQTKPPTLPCISPSCIKAPTPLHEVFQTLTISFQFLCYTSGDNSFIFE